MLIQCKGCTNKAYMDIHAYAYGYCYICYTLVPNHIPVEQYGDYLDAYFKKVPKLMY